MYSTAPFSKMLHIAFLHHLSVSFKNLFTSHRLKLAAGSVRNKQP